MNLLYGIIIGIVAEKLLFPLIDELSKLIILHIDEKKNRILCQISWSNNQLDEEDVKSNPIGFRISDKGDD